MPLFGFNCLMRITCGWLLWLGTLGLVELRVFAWVLLILDLWLLELFDLICCFGYLVIC